ncbi:hypothetical protein SuNHUV7_26060 (plasmid) [Pseudoseohaeicola sp. NH-UV-7]
MQGSVGFVGNSVIAAIFANVCTVSKLPLKPSLIFRPRT